MRCTRIAVAFIIPPTKSRPAGQLFDLCNKPSWKAYTLVRVGITSDIDIIAACSAK
jgi:hypothetical protein